MRPGSLRTINPGLAATVLFLLLTMSAYGQPAGDQDSHYTSAGFFDIHVCNWPDRPPFFMALFSSPHYDSIDKIEVLSPQGKPLTALELEHYLVIRPDNSPDKRVFIKQTDVQADAVDGWYSARITLDTGEVLTARDYVLLYRLGQVSGQQPAADSTVPSPPEQLSWQPVTGAGYYQVFIRDIWDSGRLVHTSKLLTEPNLVLPAGLLQPGGYYSWVVHARDVNEDVRLGDFNAGSMNQPVTFSIAPGP